MNHIDVTNAVKQITLAVELDTNSVNSRIDIGPAAIAPIFI
jgi:hypothetical protein